MHTNVNNTQVLQNQMMLSFLSHLVLAELKVIIGTICSVLDMTFAKVVVAEGFTEWNQDLTHIKSLCDFLTTNDWATPQQTLESDPKWGWREVPGGTFSDPRKGFAMLFAVMIQIMIWLV